MSHASNINLEESLDPHGFKAGHGGHHISSMFCLLGVLTALLVFTLLTVFASRAEMWISVTFDVMIPQWINVAVALSIAVVKSVLVALYFMHLRHDNPLNAVIFCSCLFLFTLFLGFSMLDLKNRDTIYTWKSGEIVKGGLGGVQRGDGAGGKETVSGPIKDFVREKRISQVGPIQFAREEAEHHAGHKEPVISSAQMSRPGQGMNRGGDDGHSAGGHDEAAPQGGH